MATKKKMLQAAAGNAGGEALNVEDVFSTYLYDGTSGNIPVSNGVNLLDEGGLTWVKKRTSSENHYLIDTERGANKNLASNSNAAQTSVTTISHFYNDGFLIRANLSTVGQEYATWTFRKAPKFFDVVTWTGTGSASTNISHSLGVAPAVIIIKRTDSTSDWGVWHRGNGFTDYTGLSLNATTSSAQQNPNSYQYFTDTYFKPTYVYDDSNASMNVNGGTYVAYLFAHNDGDGEFGPDGDADIIKCGVYTGTGSDNGPTINLGFEPQWLMVKNATGNGGWLITDNMRGFNVTLNKNLLADENIPETQADTGHWADVTSTGFKITNSSAYSNQNNTKYIYMAIRRGTKVPESADEVFAIATQNEVSSAKYGYYSGFPVDMAWRSLTTGEQAYMSARLIQGFELRADSTAGDSTMSYSQFDDQESWWELVSTATNRYSWMLKRAPGFFDIVAYKGSGGVGVKNHNLGVAPEMMIIKNRNDTDSWGVYHKDTGNTGYLPLNLTSGFLPSSGAFNNTTPTASTFTVGSTFNFSSSFNYIAFLFASLDGVSKVGSYTGNGTSQTIDCGFSSGASFVLVKRTSPSGDWRYFDSKRGIVAGADTSSKFNATSGGMRTGYDDIDPDNSGFIINETSTSNLNVSGANYIFYAIAAI